MTSLQTSPALSRTTSEFPQRTNSSTESAKRLPPPDQSETEIFDLFSTPHQDELTQVFALPSESAPALQRPVLLVHGYNGSDKSWKNMRTWLTNTSQNKDGGLVGPKNAGALDPSAKVFIMEYSRPFNSVKSNAAELRSAVDRIVSATGVKGIDIVSHSKGGLDTRAYLDQGNELVDKVVQIATPNHGSILADIELQFREFGMPLLPSTDDPEVRQALTDLRAERKVDGKPANPTVSELNKNWDRQKDKAEFFQISGNGLPTLKSRHCLTHKGDGVVSRESVQLPGVPMKNIWWTNHLSETSNPDVLTAAANFLVGKAIDLKDSDPNIPADQEIVPVLVAGNTGQVQYSYKDKDKI